MDSLDEKLIQLLREDAKQSTELIAKKLNVSTDTIRRRVRNLLKSEVIHIVGVPDYNKIGAPFTTLIGLDVAHDKLDTVKQALIKRPEVIMILTTTGQFDMIIMVMLSGSNELYDFIQKVLPKLGGVRNSETFVCLQLWRR